MRTRFGKQVDSLSAKAQNLPPLLVGDVCRVQNQTGQHPTKWDKTGEVVQVNSNDQYLVKMHGSRRVTLRNRKFLRKIQPLVSDKQTTSRAYVVPTPAPASAPTVEGTLIPAASDTHPEPPNNHNIVDSPSGPAPHNDLVPPAASPAIAPTDSTIVNPTNLVDGPTLDSTIQGTKVTTPPRRPTRIRGVPAWHADYAIDTFNVIGGVVYTFVAH